MRRIIIFTLCLVLANITFINSSAETSELLDSKGPSKITMKGTLFSIPLRSVTSPIEVSQDDNNIYVNFLCNLGNLNIVVLNPNGTQIYQKTVNATNGSSLTISTGLWPTGDYTIQISDTQGGFMEGVFTVE